jgi:peroxiredoxin Q/BCP
MNLHVGQEAPEFCLPDQNDERKCLHNFRGQWVVLYFYTKYDTPGCTTEACSMRDNFEQLGNLQAVVLGVSVDSVKSHKKFAEKYNLPFTLLADQDKQVVNQYGVWGEKSFMGKKYMGTNRTTFLIDPQGTIVHIFENVKPDGHASQVAQVLLEKQTK